MQTDVKGQFLYTVTSKQGFHCDGFSITDTSQKPVVDFSIKVSGTIYIGVEFAPSVKAGVYKISKPRTDENFLTLMELKLTFSIGAEGSLTPNVPVEPVAVNQISHKFSGNSIHECNACLAGDVYSKVVFSVTVNVIKIFDQTATLLDYRQHILTLYYSINYNDLGFGTCPHNLYLVDITVDAVIPPSGSEVIDGEGQSIGTLSASDKNYCYMRPGTYTLETTIDGNRYSHTFTVGSSNIDVKLTLNGGSSGGGSSGGGSSDPSLWALDENGKLTINNEKVMTDYSDAASTPWYGSRDKITSILTQYNVKTISNYAFADCSKVTEIYIGDEITRIGDYAFSGCSSLTKVTFVGTMAQWKALPIGVGNDILKKVNVICSDGEITGTVSEPPKEDSNLIASGSCGVEGIWNDNVKWTLDRNGKLTIRGIGQMKSYDGSSFVSPWYCYRGQIKTVEIMSNITNIGDFAFHYCTELTSVIISPAVTEIGRWAFGNCGKLRKIVIPYGVSEIKSSAFHGSGLTSIIIPSSVSEIESGAFSRCTELADITIPSSIEVLKEGTFAYCNNLTNVSIPSGIKEIEKGVFENCRNLSDVTMASSVEKIGEGAFSGCDKLSNITLSSSLTEIESETFAGCRGLTNISIPSSVKTIKRFAFRTCSGLTDIIIPHGVIELEDSAFCDCSGLISVTIPTSVESIGAEVFSSTDSALKEIIYNGTIAQWSAISKGVNWSFRTTTIHCSDGDILPTATSNLSSEENSIIPSTDTATSGNNYVASFMGLTPGVNYAVIVSESETDPLDPQNLIYINQFCASSEDYQQTFRTKSGSGITDLDMVYVVAAGSYTFDDSPSTPVARLLVVTLVLTAVPEAVVTVTEAEPVPCCWWVPVPRRRPLRPVSC